MEESGTTFDISAQYARDDLSLMVLPSSLWTGHQMTQEEIERYEQLLIDEDEEGEDIDCIQKGEMEV